MSVYEEDGNSVNTTNSLENPILSNLGFSDFNPSTASSFTSPFLECHRGMNNVSRFAKNAFVRKQNEVKDVFFPGGKTKQVNDVKVTVDVDTDPNRIIHIEKRKLFLDKNLNRRVDKGKDLFLYNVELYFSKDAIKLKNAFEETEVDPQGVIFFIEDNTDDISSQFCRVKIGSDVRSRLTKKAQLYNNKTVLDYLNKYVEIDRELLNELVQNGKIENFTLKTVEFLFSALDYLDPFSLDEKILKGLGWVSGEIADFILKGKLADHRWNPNAKKLNEDGSEDEDHEFSPFFFPFVEDIFDEIPDEKINSYATEAFNKLETGFLDYDNRIRSYMENTDIGTNYIPLTLGGSYLGVIEVDLLPDSVEAYVYGKYKKASDAIKSVFKKLESFDFSDMLKKGIRMLNAFLCGIWNALVDALAGIFSLLEMIFNAIVALKDFRKNFSTQFPIFMEHVDNIIAAIKVFDFNGVYKYVKEKLDEGFNISLETMAYFSGAIIGFVISLIIEIVIGILFTGGVLSIGAVLKRLFSIFSSIVKGIARAGRKTFDVGKKIVVNSFKGVAKLLQDITNFFRKGKQGFIDVINKFFTSIRSVDQKGKIIDDFFKSLDDLKKTLNDANINTKYSRHSLNVLIAEAKKLNIPKEFLIDFIRLGHIKKIGVNNLKRQMRHYVNVVKKRGYPMKFRSLKQFKLFSKEILDDLRKIGLPIDDVRVQGSSLRTLRPKDIDLAVFVDDGVFNQYLKKAFKGKIKFDDEIIDISNMASDELKSISSKIMQNKELSNATSRTFAFAFKNGKISALSRSPRIIPGLRNVVKKLNKNYSKLNIEDISVQKRGGKLELKPDLKIEL